MQRAGQGAIGYLLPSCWNGKDLDSADHRSHMAYPISGSGRQGTVCPGVPSGAGDARELPLCLWVKPAVSNPATQSNRGWRLASDMYEVTDTQAGIIIAWRLV